MKRLPMPRTNEIRAYKIINSAFPEVTKNKKHRIVTFRGFDYRATRIEVKKLNDITAYEFLDFLHVIGSDSKRFYHVRIAEWTTDGFTGQGEPIKPGTLTTDDMSRAIEHITALRVIFKDTCEPWNE